MGHGAGDHQSGEHTEHHILSNKTAFTIFMALCIGTVITVLSAQIDLGVLNFPLAMLIATSKAALVVLFFMALKYDNAETRLTAFSALIFVSIFIILTGIDIFFRGDVYVKKGDEQRFAAPGGASSGGGKFPQPWVPSPEVAAYGKTIFSTQCASCHGSEGKGDGPAAGALNPPPRNFTQTANWVNERKLSGIFHVLTEGLKRNGQPTAMPPFTHLPAEDRFAVAQYVLTLGPAAAETTIADLKAVGFDPATAGQAQKKREIGISDAMKVISEEKK